MIVTASCPLRISLVGGSTDHPEFLERFGSGSVISFPSNLRTYSTIHRDVFGSNSLKSNYVLNYSRREEVDRIDQISNELIRYCFEELELQEVNLFFTSDVYSSGSGLASSSAYLMSLIKAVHEIRNEGVDEMELCEVAMRIERRFNPLVGQQDFYGSMGGLKRINFNHMGKPEFKYLDSKIFDGMDIFLLHTGIARNSTEVLKSIDVEKSLPLLEDVDDLENCIESCDLDGFHEVMNRTWQNKKRTSPKICENLELINLDSTLEKDPEVLSHKLLGAGNGGYFLIFSRKNMEDYFYKQYYRISKISISKEGVQSVTL